MRIKDQLEIIGLKMMLVCACNELGDWKVELDKIKAKILRGECDHLKTDWNEL